MVACLTPQRMQRKRRDAPRSWTMPNPFTAAFALSVREDPQCVQSIFRAQPKRIRSAVVLTCFVDKRGNQRVEPRLFSKRLPQASAAA